MQKKKKKIQRQQLEYQNVFLTLPLKTLSFYSGLC